jgi:protein involved in polysaccharide export with SLBB domain
VSVLEAGVRPHATLLGEESVNRAVKRAVRRSARLAADQAAVHGWSAARRAAPVGGGRRSILRPAVPFGRPLPMPCHDESAPRPRGLSGLGLLTLLAVLVQFLSGCSTTPDKRVLQYLNQEGYGKRYVGNVREEAYLTIGDGLSLLDEFDPGFAVEAVVELDGTIFVPELGNVPVAGMTRSEVESYLTQRRAEILVRTSVKVRRLLLTPRYYWVFGEVAAPGRVPLTEDLTIFDVVGLARPIPATANIGRIRLVRADPVDPLVMYFDFGRMLRGGDSSRDYGIMENDIIVVPPTFMTRLGNFLAALVSPFGLILNSITAGLLNLARIDRLSGNDSLLLF